MIDDNGSGDVLRKCTGASSCSDCVAGTYSSSAGADHAVLQILLASAKEMYIVVRLSEHVLLVLIQNGRY
jgi:hypothetical protein